MSADQIFISGLRVEAVIGVYPEERLSPQPLLIDIELAVDTRRAAAVDRIAETIDYAKITENIKKIAAKSAFFLIETLANRCADYILENFTLDSVLVKVSKFPHELSVTSVGVVVKRLRNAHT